MRYEHCEVIVKLVLQVSQIMELFSWRDILTIERSRVSMTTDLVLVPGPVDGAASVLDEVV